MFGGGDQRLTPKDSEMSQQLPINPRAMIISDPSAALNLACQNSPRVFAGEGMQNGTLIQQAGSIIIHSKKLQDDLQELGQKIKHNEDNIKYLKTQKTKLEESILDMTATLEKYHKTSFSTTQNQDLDLSKSEEETLGNILKHEKSAAALLCMIKNQPESQASDNASTKDVLGIVATLGKVDDDNLSRLLSEYLGLETMLALVCKTYEGVNALEAYNKEGSINKSLGLHALATSTRRSLDDPFLVICLECLRPYPGAFIADDSQRRLDLLKPRIINGETPAGFLGFAVNMINIDRAHLYYITKSGFGLRETLFYNLLSSLQVYKSREDMLKALPYIPDGAISLDGGMIKSPGMFRLAPPREHVKFAVGFERLSLSQKYLEIENQIKETKWKKDRMAEDLLREQSFLDHAKANYEIKKQEFLKFLAESSMYTAQFPPQNVQNVQGFGNFMNHPNYATRGPQQPFPTEYWQNTSYQQFTSPVLQGFGTPHTTGTYFSSSMPTEPATLTFVLETQLSDRESPIEVVNLEKTIPDAEGPRKRSTWTKVEDEVLARSFVTISDDPIIGNDQKAYAFWGRVANYYNENRAPGSQSRKANVIRSHWHNTIQKKVNRFNANYNSIYSLYRGGHSDEDILRFAYEKYRDENNGVGFNLEHVWRIVKDRPMFTPQSDDHFVATKKTRTSESGASNTSSNQNVSTDIDDEAPRPMGRNAAKRKGKDKVKSTMEDMTVNYDSIFSKFNEYTTVKKSEVDLKQKQLEVEEIKAKASLTNAESKNRRVRLKEYEILNKDTSQMTVDQLIIHECMCKDIRSRWNI